MNLTEKEIKQITPLLRKQHAGYLPYQLLIELSRLIVLPIVELVPLSKSKEGNIMVLLQKRAKDDPYWPDKFHTLGTILRVDDTSSSMDSVFSRLKEELGNPVSYKIPVYFAHYNRTSRRSRELAICYWVELSMTDRIQGTWYSSNSLPVNLVTNQKSLIQDAIKNYIEINPK